MTNLILCHSALAENPYYLVALGIHIYSIEELCFLLKENACILDDDVLDKELCTFLIEEAEMPVLGKKLRYMLEDGVTAGEFIMTILEDSMLLSGEELSEVRQTLVDSAGLDRNRKHKRRGDNMLRNKKYTLALDEYRYILDSMERDYDRETYAAVLHNMGTAYAGMFLLKEASECFFDSYELSGERESAVSFLLATKACYEPEKYDRLLLRYGFNDEVVREAKRRYEELKTPQKDSPQGRILDKITDLRESGKISEYYRVLDETLHNWKQEYRRTMGVFKTTYQSNIR